MILKCPNCGCQYEIQSSSEIKNFTMKCTSCGFYLSTENAIAGDFIPLARLEGRPKSHSKWKWVVCAVILLLGLMAFTRPNKTAHTEKIRELVLDEMCQRTDMGSLIAQGVTAIFGSDYIDGFIDMALHVDDYFVVNIGRIKYGDVNRIVSMGVFNRVFLLVEADELKKEVEAGQ